MSFFEKTGEHRSISFCTPMVLSQRYQAVRIKSVLSDTLPVVSGVPHGSFLGALLFSIYVNDQPTVCQTVQPPATWMTPSFYCLLP